MKFKVTLALAILSAVATSFGGVIAYEGFDTTNAVGSDASTAGVTGSGFSAYGDTNFRMDLEDGLSYADSSGNILNVTGKSAGMDAVVGGTQNLQLTLSSSVSNSGTLYLSFLTEVTAVDSFGVMIGLQDSQVTNSASPLNSLEAALRSTSSNYGIYSDGNGIDERTGPATGTITILFVAELDMDTETMTGYFNPSDLADVAGSATHTVSEAATGTWDDMTSFLFSLGGEEAGTIDEIRLGDTITDVTPFTAVPEPSTSIFAIIASLALLRRKR